MSDAQQKIIEFIKELTMQTPEKPDHWASCAQCSNNTGKAEDLLELIEKETQPTDTEMLDWLLNQNAMYAAFLIDSREAIAAEKAARVLVRLAMVASEDAVMKELDNENVQP